ncbi:glucan biosynthesis protein D [Pseudomonas sp. MM211]|uniref:glucan biosynthesis protein n=1 Tax=Pseudomonas sp. MM211 TaxID=2866808 RepID=UPI001CECC517|nr:glucan biosynthesis protein D [Pseudomonas sp. MM211]UCJ18795.1 glucan biosynthesis protein D [Pseudomonas sp. MM211]
MQRRNLLKASMLMAACAGLPAGLFSLRSFAETADGKAEPFDFKQLQSRAKSMAGRAYKSTAEVLPKTLAELTPQQFNAIQYDPAHSLWNELDGQLDVQFFHVGMGFRQPVRMHAVDAKTRLAREVHFRPELFEYGKSEVDVAQLKGDLGFAGLKVFKQPNIAKYDIVSFLGASYFRAVDNTGQYGLSARGLAIDTFTDTPEEFPDFTEFWFETPDKNATRFVLYALLDSPSATGAFRFDIDCLEDRVVMDIDAHINARKTIKQLGISPMTSMFSCGGHERRMCDFVATAIHDSDRLSMWRGNGEWVCRPLNNPEKLQFNAFSDTNPKGFGLVQFDHDFKSYQDTVVWYSRRPSLWVEPTTPWGEGSIDLLEIPTTGETMDNIVCFWNPKQAIEPGTSLNFGYKLHWAALPPVKPTLAQVHATRSGMGGFTLGWAPGEHWPKEWARRFAIDFGGGPLAKMDAKAQVEVVVEASHGEVKDYSILALYPDVEGFRAQFDWFPTSDSVEPVNMRAYLRRVDNKEVLSETWLYQYFPPAPAERRYPDWKAES